MKHDQMTKQYEDENPWCIVDLDEQIIRDRFPTEEDAEYAMDHWDYDGNNEVIRR